MKYYVKWFWEKTSLVLTEEDEFQKVKQAEKVEFVNQFKSGDETYLEFSGAGDHFVLSAINKGVKVFRIPTFVQKQKRQEFSISDKNSDPMLLKKIAEGSPDLFYPVRPVDKDILHLRYLVRSFYAVQDLRKVVDQRLWLVLKDLVLLEDPDRDIEVEVKTRMKNLGISAGVHEQEKQLKKGIENLLSQIPVYSAVFEPIYGCGPLIAGRFIGEIGDIRRFHDAAALKAYAGYHLKNKEVPKKRKGETANWNNSLKLAVWLFLDQVNRHDFEKCPWKRILVKRKAYERERHPEPERVLDKDKNLIRTKDGKIIYQYTKGHIHARSLRYVGGKFLEHVFTKWNQFEREQGN